MAVAFDAATGGSLAGASSVTIGHTSSGSDRVGCAQFGWNDSSGTGTVSSITWGGTGMVSVVGAGPAGGGNNERTKIYRHIAPATSSQNLVINFSEAAYGYAAACSYTGVDQTTPVSNSNSATGNGATASVAVTSATDELVIDVVKFFEGGTDLNATPGAGQTERFDGTDGSFGDEAAGSTEAGAASVTMSWTGFDTNWAVCGASLKVAGAGGGSTQPPRTMFVERLRRAA